MTGYTVHTGASKKFVSGWDRIFSEGDSPGKESEKAKAKKASKDGVKAKAKKKK